MNLYKQIEKISNERTKLRAELLQIKEERISLKDQLSQENSKLKTKIFLLEQELLKKNNILNANKNMQKKSNKIFDINNLNLTSVNYKTENSPNNQENNRKSKSQNQKNNSEYSNRFFRNKSKNVEVIYVVDPTQAILKLNNELLLYKNSFLKSNEITKKQKKSIEEYEKLLTKLDNENQKLKEKCKLKLAKINNEKDTMLNMITQNIFQTEYLYNQKQQNEKYADDLDVCDKSNNFSNNISSIITDNIKRYEEEKYNLIHRESTMEEFGKILNNVGLTREIFEKMSKYEEFGKLTDSIEYFYKLVLEKNKQITILEQENESLVSENFDLNKKNIELEEQIKKIKKLFDNSKNLEGNNEQLVYLDKILNDDSMNNNFNQKSILSSKINDNTSGQLITYQKMLKKQKEDVDLKTADILFNLLSDSEDNENETEGIKGNKTSIHNYEKNESNNCNIIDENKDNICENNPSNNYILNINDIESINKDNKNSEQLDNIISENSIDLKMNILTEMEKQEG